MKIVNSTPNVLKDKLDIAIQKAVADYMADYKLNNPNFSRKRVLTMDKVIKLLLSMQGGSLKKELYDAGMTRKELNQKHWRYYLMLEKRFIESMEYVELHQDNYNTFSNGYALLLQAIGAELDTVFKEFCGFNTSDRKTIADYAQYILTNKPDIINQKIVLQEYDIVIQPFQNWNVSQPAQTLQWWNAFTDIKHNRYDQLKLAKQENVLNILGALYLIEMMYLKKITENTSEVDIFDESSKLFTLKNWTSKAIPMDEVFVVLGDMLENGDNISSKTFDA